MPKPLNCTDIAFFIPKKANTARVTGYRPIDLTNIVYRIIAKSLANRRLKEELHDYTQGRRITGNIIIVQETIHSFNLKSFAQHVFMLKIDLVTVFDHIECPFCPRCITTSATRQTFNQTNPCLHFNCLLCY